MKKDIAIEIEGVFKNFVLPHEKVGTVKNLFTKSLRKSKSIEVQHALKNISLEIIKGEFFGIVGRNGSGKSTLLKIIAGIYQPTKGSVKVNGKLVPFIELGVGFNPELTGRENVYLNGAILGFTTKQIDANYKNIVEFAELEEFMDQKLKNYSSGMQVRLAFACATKAKADILLIDEVLAVGDADFQRKCFNYFKGLKKQGTTVVFVTHDMSAVVEYCDRAAFINNALLENIGDTEHISELYTKLFNDSSLINTTQHQDDSQRWGNGDIFFSSKPIIAIKEDTISLTVDITQKNIIDTPIFGISIKDAKGQVVVGTNSKIIKFKKKQTKSFKKFTITWKIANIFSTGIYNVDIAVHSADGATMYERWNNATSFDYYNKYSSPYSVTPPANLSINLPSISKKSS